MKHVMLDGVLQPAEAARIAVEDAGFLLGDGVFETIRVEDGRTLRLDAHLERLERSATAVGIRLPWKAKALRSQVTELLAAERSPLQRLRITVTRGAGAGATVLLAAIDWEAPDAEVYETGVAVEISRTLRRPHPLHQVKTTSQAANAWLRREATALDTFEVLVFNDAGGLAEGSFTNVFVVDAAGRLKTPALTDGCLAGITRAAVLTLAREQKVDASEGRIDRTALDNAREVFLTSSLVEIVPVQRISGKLVGAGRAGPVTRSLQAAYDEARA